MPERLTRRKLVKRGLAIGAAAVAGDAFGLEPEWIQVERVEVAIRGLGNAFDGYRIALFSDIHWPRQIERGFIDRIVALANAFDPDIVAIPGDLVDHTYGASPYRPPDFTGVFDRLKARDGIFATMGNHDHLFIQKTLVEAIHAQTPIQVLYNAREIVRKGRDRLAIGGVDDLWMGRPDLELAFQNVPAHVPRILLSHNPDLAEDAIPEVRVDLQLSGHTHGGEFRVPFGPAPIVPSKYGQKFRAGLVQGRNHRVYVTRGICSFRRARFFCRPEVTYLTLRAGSP